MKLKDILNQTINKTNKQVSFNIRKKELKKTNIDLKDILNMEIKSEKIEFE